MQDAVGPSKNPHQSDSGQCLYAGPQNKTIIQFGFSRSSYAMNTNNTQDSLQEKLILNELLL